MRYDTVKVFKPKCPICKRLSTPVMVELREPLKLDCKCGVEIMPISEGFESDNITIDNRKIVGSSMNKN